MRIKYLHAKRQGFTLIELMVVIGILAFILVLVAGGLALAIKLSHASKSPIGNYGERVGYIRDVSAMADLNGTNRWKCELEAGEKGSVVPLVIIGDGELAERMKESMRARRRVAIQYYQHRGSLDLSSEPSLRATNLVEARVEK